jgi:hypothetical protein
MDSRLKCLIPYATILSASILILLQACATTSSNENPWATPDRGFSVSSEKEKTELLAFMQPCVEPARETLPEVALRFKAGFPPETFFYVVARTDNEYNFFVEVKAIDGNRIHGRIQSAADVNGRHYASGDEYSLAIADTVDWLVIYPDRPEEGNLLGKYMLLLQDGLMFGPCNPQDSELQHFRLFRENYSFVPPSGAGWKLHGKYADSDVSLQKDGEGPNELNTIFAVRYKVPLFKTDQELVTKIMEAEKKNLGDPNRYTLKEHTVTAYTEKETRCALSHQVIEDKKALLAKSGERGPMIREILSLVCVHPREWDTAVNLTYSHRYQPGHRDSEFTDKANTIFNSLAFKTYY